MHLLSLLLGLVFAWVLLLFIGPKKCVSYYVQAPVVGAPIVMDDVDKMMEAVGLSRQARSPAPAPFPARAPAPAPEPSIADIAIQEEVQTPAPMVPEPMAPSPAPAPTPVQASSPAAF
jgi:hypothetical protein